MQQVLQQASPGHEPGAPPLARQRARLTREGVLLGSEVVPLLSGSVHYWRLEPQSWRPCLESVRAMGCTAIDVYVPWSVHEFDRGQFDFGERQPELDVKGFLRVAWELGLFALVRPGPHINAELSGFGLPERVLWNPDCQARSAAGEPVVLPIPPRAFPIPSYASRTLLEEARLWLERVGRELGALAWPDGPIVMCQIDNEGALYFRDGVYEQDYHPDSITRFHERLAQRYGAPERLGQAYSIPANSFAIPPPSRLDAKSPEELLRHLDWAEHQEQLLVDAFGEFRRALHGAGLERVPTCHNLPMGDAMTPLDPASLGKVVDCLGIDYYHVASGASAHAILQRTSRVATRADAFDYPCFAIELAAGFPPFFPPLTEQDNRFAALSCLAGGVRAYNIYMAVERDRWIGAPIDRFGGRRPSFQFWQSLSAAISRSRLPTLSRAADVCIVVPRSLQRLRRLLHAFGPLSAAAFELMGLEARDTCLEDAPLAAELFAAEDLLRALTDELDRRGVTYTLAGDDAAVSAVGQARFGFVITGAGIEAELYASLQRLAADGKPVLFGPEPPGRTPRGEPLAVSGPAAAEALTRQNVAARVTELCQAHQPFALPLSEGLRAALFRDASGNPRVLFLTNATPEPRTARVEIGSATAGVDALDREAFRARFGALEVPLSPLSVRMLELT